MNVADHESIPGHGKAAEQQGEEKQSWVPAPQRSRNELGERKFARKGERRDTETTATLVMHLYSVKPSATAEDKEKAKEDSGVGVGARPTRGRGRVRRARGCVWNSCRCTSPGMPKARRGHWREAKRQLVSTVQVTVQRGASASYKHPHSARQSCRQGRCERAV